MIAAVCFCWVNANSARQCELITAYCWSWAYGSVQGAQLILAGCPWVCSQPKRKLRVVMASLTCLVMAYSLAGQGTWVGHVSPSTRLVWAYGAHRILRNSVRLLETLKLTNTTSSTSFGLRQVPKIAPNQDWRLCINSLHLAIIHTPSNSFM